jgi:hypothetical protein
MAGPSLPRYMFWAHIIYLLRLPPVHEPGSVQVSIEHGRRLRTILTTSMLMLYIGKDSGSLGFAGRKL